MWQVEGEPQCDLPDVARFVATINAHTGFFEKNRPVVVARAPGRLDLMGGIADYSGSLVLELPLAVATLAAAQLTDEPCITLRTLATSGADHSEVAIPLEALAPGGAPIPYAEARALFAAEPRQHWAAYVAGALVVLGHEKGMPVTRGLRLLIASSVPAGKGVSSSAALEVAAMQAIRVVCDVALEGREMALLCQRVENQVVGAPCGVMDQMTSACGQHDQLLALLCQPAELQPPVVLPAGLEVWGIDSGIRHAVTGADYGAVRVGAFMGYRIIADLAGLSVSEAPEGRVRVHDPEWQGYLANLIPSVWESAYRDRVPLTLDGAAFLARYGGTTDPATRVEPERTYAVRQPTAHPIYEHHRVQLFRVLLEKPSLGEADRALLGELMYQSHVSYSACGLGSSGTNRLVEQVRAAGPEAGLYGAKITGGGSGGTVAVLARRGAADVIAGIAREYERDTGHRTTVLGHSSPGAVAFGSVRLRWL